MWKRVTAHIPLGDSTVLGGDDPRSRICEIACHLDILLLCCLL